MRHVLIKSLLRSTVFRVSLLNATLLALAMAGAGTGAWLTTRGMAERDAHDRVLLETRAVAIELAQEGSDRAVDAIRSRAERPGALEYLLVNPHGQVIAGDMTMVPRSSGWHRLKLPDTAIGFEGKEELLALTTRLPDGTFLAIGDDLGRAEAVRKAVFGSLMTAGGISLLLVLVAGIVATRRVLRRMQNMVLTVRSVEAGDFDARVSELSEMRDDVDELGKAINGMLDRIASLVATVRRVSAEVAHDLRTPLTRVQHLLDAAATADDSEGRRVAMEGATESVQQALRLFDAMLDLAEIDAGEARTRFAEMDLTMLAEQVVDAYRPEIELSGRSIALVVNDACPLQGDADLLTRAIANLVDNALKHSRVGASIVVRVGVAASGAWILVEDDGPGVAASDVGTMLRPFGRLDPARTTSGNGLGLAIVRGIAELHGGRIVLGDQKPGLSVRIELPRRHVFGI